MKCKACSSESNTSILDLGDHPWCNDFLKKEDLGKENSYPLHLVHCNKCELLQLNYVVPKEVMFKNHTYVSSTTKTLSNHFHELALENKKQFNLDKDDLVLDIGGNDGTQLLQYKKAGIENVLNVESADNIAKLSVESGVQTINDFFNEDLIDKHQLQNKVKLINASGVFFHLEELHSVIKGIKKALTKDGVFVVQFMYAGTMVEKLNFDGIYHEHLCFYTLKSLSNLLEPYGFKIFDAYYSEIHSGSIIAKVSLDKSTQVTERGVEAFEKDKKYNKESFLKFAEVVKSKKNNLKNLLVDIKNKNPKAKIYAYGAPAKGNTLLNYFEIDNKLVDKCAEVNELKIGLYLPKSHIPIIKESTDDVPDYYLLLAHNFADEIIERNKDLIDKGVKFIIPFPDIKII
jgi:riboflavin biosynthesis pyrimidine reductase